MPLAPVYPWPNSAVDRLQWPRKDYHADPRHIAIVAALRADICLTQETMTMDAHIEGMAVVPSHEFFLAHGYLNETKLIV